MRVSNRQLSDIGAICLADTTPPFAAIEMQFAVAAVEQSEVYWNLITKIQPSKLTRLTQ